jgi:thiol-disulfide isomerase/thioredoxin
MPSVVHRFFVLSLVGFCLLAGGTVTADPPGADAVEVKVRNYSEMLDTVKHLRGRVLVVDFWADTCLICKKEFPHLVQMHQKYGPEGMAAISVSLDDPSQPGAQEKVLRFLKAQRASFTNLILNEKPEVWQEKFGFDGPPCVFVFDRQGEIKKQFKDEFSYADVEKLVKELLAKK